MPPSCGAMVLSNASIVTSGTQSTFDTTALRFQADRKELKVDETLAGDFLAKVMENTNSTTQNDAKDEAPDVDADEAQGGDTGILLQSKDAAITTLQAKLAAEIGDREAVTKQLAVAKDHIATLEERVVALVTKLRDSEERANKMKDVAMFVMGNM